MENYGIEHFDEGAQEATLWVGPDGTDNAEGTHENPLASIQTAIDRLSEEVGAFEQKQVLLKPGTYTENIIINIPKLTLRGVSIKTTRNSENLGDEHGPKPVNILPENGDRPVCTITNMTKSGYADFEADGGASYSWTAPDSYSYTGASLANRETVDVPLQDVTHRFNMDLRIANIFFGGFDLTNAAEPTGMLILGVPQDGQDAVRLNTIILESIGIRADDKTSIFAKNIKSIELASLRLVADVNHVFDRVNSVMLTHRRDSIVTGVSRYVTGNLILHGDSSVSADQGGIERTTLLSAFSVDPSPFHKNIYLIGQTSVRSNSGHAWVTVGPNSKLGMSTQENYGRISVSVGTYTNTGSGSESYVNLYCGSGSYTGTGDIDVNEFKCNGTFTFGGGTGHIIRGGFVDGDFIFEGGCTAVLREMVIKGDLIIRDSGTQIDAEGCHVQGSVQLETTIDTQQNFYGGSIIGEGHTNEVRDENGNDQSGSSNWNRVSGV